MRKWLVSEIRFFQIFGAIIAALLCSTQLLSAQQSDIVITLNGDRVIGEVRKLDRGILEFKTKDMGTLLIEWEAVSSIQSIHLYDIEIFLGEHYFGSLEQAEERGMLKIITVTEPITVSLSDVVRIYPLEFSAWKRIKGYLDFGISYQSADEFVEVTLGTDATYRSEKWANTLAIDTYLRTQKEGPRTRRNNLSYILERFIQRRWSGDLFGTLEQNDELELDLRVLIGAGIGRYLIQNNHMLFKIFAGADVIRVKRFDDESFATNLEAMFGGRFETFRYSTPKLDFTTDLSLSPNLTEWGQLRIYFNTRIRYEILKDFYIGLTVFDKFDGDLSEGGIRKNDFGINTTISWSFK